MKCPKCSRWIADGSESHGKCGWGGGFDFRTDGLPCNECGAQDDAITPERTMSIDMTQWEMLGFDGRKILCPDCMKKFHRQNSALYVRDRMGLTSLAEKMRYCHEPAFRGEIDARMKS